MGKTLNDEKRFTFGRDHVPEYKISLALLRTSIINLHGARSMRRRSAVEALLGTIVEELKLLC